MSWLRADAEAKIKTIEDKLNEKTPLKEQAELELMKLRCEIKELKNDLAKYNKELDDQPKPEKPSVKGQKKKKLK